MSPRFLSAADLEAVHRHWRATMGPDTEPSVNRRALEEVATHPRAGGEGGVLFYGDLYGIAAAYLCQLIERQPFDEGTEATALLAALVFLELNWVGIEETSPMLARLARDVSRGQEGWRGVADVLRRLTSLARAG